MDALEGCMDGCGDRGMDAWRDACMRVYGQMHGVDEGCIDAWIHA